MAPARSRFSSTWCSALNRPLSWFDVRQYICLIAHVLWFPQLFKRYLQQNKVSNTLSDNELKILLMSVVATVIGCGFLSVFFVAYMGQGPHDSLLISWLIMTSSGALGAIFCVYMFLNIRNSAFGVINALPIGMISTTFAALTILYYNSLFPSWKMLAIFAFLFGCFFGISVSISLAYINRGLPNVYDIGLIFSPIIGLYYLINRLSVAIFPKEITLLDYNVTIAITLPFLFLGYIISVHRLDDWFIGYFMIKLHLDDPLAYVPYVTPIPMSHVVQAVFHYCKNNPSFNIKNLEDVWQTSRQQIAIIRGVYNCLLNSQGVDSLKIIDSFNFPDSPWRLETFANGDDRSYFDWDHLLTTELLPNSISRSQKLLTMAEKVVSTTPSTSNHIKLSTNGWLIYQGQTQVAPEDAKRTVAQLPLIPELDSYSHDRRLAITYLNNLENIQSIFRSDIEQKCREWKTENYGYYPREWSEIKFMHDILQFAQLYKYCHSEHNRATILANVRNSLTVIQKRMSADPLYNEIGNKIEKLIKKWQNDQRYLFNVNKREFFTAIPIDLHMESTQNPFIYAEPLVDKMLFKAHMDALGELRKIWQGDQLHHVYLSGPVLSGKTSLVRVIANDDALKDKLVLLYVSFNHLSNELKGIRSVASAILDVISDVTEIEVTDAEKSLLLEEPIRLLDKKIKSLCFALAKSKKVIIALDDFSAVGNIVNASEFERLMHFLNHLSELLHNLGILIIDNDGGSELYQRYKTSTARLTHHIPLTIVVKNEISYIEYLLQFPTPDFPFKFDPLAIRRICELTNGQPYLVQLVAWHTFSQFMQYKSNPVVKTKFGTEHYYDPLFSLENIEQTIRNELCREGIEYYYKRLLKYFGNNAGLVDEILHLFDRNIWLNTKVISDNFIDEARPIIRQLLYTLCEHGILKQSSDSFMLKMEILIELFQK